MNCTRCGKPLPEGAKFCQECGQPVSEAVSISGTGNSFAPPGSSYTLGTGDLGSQTGQNEAPQAGTFSPKPSPSGGYPGYPQPGSGYSVPAPPLLPGSTPPPPGYVYSSPAGAATPGSRQGNPWLLGGGIALLVIGLLLVLIMVLVGVYGTSLPDQSAQDLRAGQFGTAICILGLLFVFGVPGVLMVIFGRAKRKA